MINNLLGKYRSLGPADIHVIEIMHEGFGLKKSPICGADCLYFINSRKGLQANAYQIVKKGTIERLYEADLITPMVKSTMWFKLTQKGRFLVMKGGYKYERA